MRVSFPPLSAQTDLLGSKHTAHTPVNATQHFIAERFILTHILSEISSKNNIFNGSST